MKAQPNVVFWLNAMQRINRQPDNFLILYSQIKYPFGLKFELEYSDSLNIERHDVKSNTLIQIMAETNAAIN